MFVSQSQFQMHWIPQKQGRKKKQIKQTKIRSKNEVKITSSRAEKFYQMSISKRTESKFQSPTMFINESIETGASRAAIEPKNHRIFNRIPLRFNEVVEQIPPVLFIDFHIPSKSKPTAFKFETKNLQKQKVNNEMWKILTRSSAGKEENRRNQGAPKWERNRPIGRKRRRVELMSSMWSPLALNWELEFRSEFLLVCNCTGISDAFGLFLLFLYSNVSAPTLLFYYFFLSLV